MEYLSKDSIVTEIQNEYKKIDNRWMKLHYYTFLFLVLFGFIVEVAIAVFWYRSGSVTISFSLYLLKYIAAPVFMNSVFLLICTLIFKSSKVKRKAKAYVISLLYVCVCLVFYIVHSIFFAIFLIFTIPILLTVIYSDYVLTSVTAALSIISKIVSELYIVWDPDKVNPMESGLGAVNFFISIFIMIVFYMVCIVVIRFEKEKIETSAKKEISHFYTRQKLKIDDLTGIYNRTALRKSFQDMIEDKSESQYYFAMIDIDNFKTLNDSYGHDEGDCCLKEFAQILTKHCVGNCTPFRFGGDEFCILFKEDSLDNVVSICKAVQRDLKNSPTSLKFITMTSSIGIAKYEDGMSVTQLVKITDSLMYLSKTQKNQIRVYGENNEHKII